MIFLLSLLCNVRHILYELSRLAGSRCPHREVEVTPDLSPLAPGSESGEELNIRVYTLAFLHWPKGRVITRSHTAWLRNYSPGNVVCMSIPPLSPPPHPIPAASPRHGRWIPRIYKRSLWIQQRLRWEQSWTWLADYVRSVWGTFSFMYASQHVQFFKFILWICSSSFQTDFWGESQRHGAATHTSLTHWLTLYEAAIQFTVIVHT